MALKNNFSLLNPNAKIFIPKSQEIEISKNQNSMEKTCGICFEVIFEKRRKFGILSGCNHCFCLNCIEKWRKTNLEKSVTKSCPECRIYSEFVYPSSFWIDGVVEKERILTKYKNDCSQKDCKYFKRGFGNCAYQNDCIYLHRLLDGTIIEDEEEEEEEVIWENFQRRIFQMNFTQQSTPRVTIIPFVFIQSDFTFYFPNEQ